MTQATTTFEPVLRESATFDRLTIQEIQRAAATGIYDIRGGGTKRHLPHFDDLLLLGASMSRYPLEGYREKCGTDVVLGTRFAKKPHSFKNSSDHCGDELWCFVCQCQRITRSWRLYGGDIDNDR